MPVLRDTFATFLSQLTAAGWIIDGYQRYRPTTLAGLTPSGKVFDVTITPDGELTVSVAGKVRTATLTQAQIESGEDTITAIAEAHGRLPENQR